jgi:hypothetical protein
MEFTAELSLEYVQKGRGSTFGLIYSNYWQSLTPSVEHLAFFTNVADMLPARDALRNIYAGAMDRNVIEELLKEMLGRGLPKAVYDKYMDEAINLGLIPKAGVSRVGGKILQESDILKKEDILREIPNQFEDDLYFYGVG